MPDTSPLIQKFKTNLPAAGATTDTTEVLVDAPYAATVTAVVYIPEAAITGANTNTRTITLVNAGQAGSGSTVAATLALTSGVNPAADTPTQFTLSGTAANLVLAAGDTLVVKSTHASSGLADPGGLVEVTLTRS